MLWHAPSKASQNWLIGSCACSAPRLRDDANVGARVRDIIVAGVSTRRYAQVLPEAAGTVGVSKTTVSRRFVEASAAYLSENPVPAGQNQASSNGLSDAYGTLHAAPSLSTLAVLGLQRVMMPT